MSLNKELGCGAQCGKCGFQYWEHNGHIVQCPKCEVENLSKIIQDIATQANQIRAHLIVADNRLGESNKQVEIERSRSERLQGRLTTLEAENEKLREANANYVERVKNRLRGASKGEPNTWGFVAMFMDMLDQEALTTPTAEIVGAIERHLAGDNDKGIKYRHNPTVEITDGVSLLKDAMRYRFLRDPNIDVGLIIDKVTGEVPAVEGMGGGGYLNYEYRAGEELDQAIDAAITAKKGQNEH